MHASCVYKAMTSVKGKLHQRLNLFESFQSNFLVWTSPCLHRFLLLKLATTFTKRFLFYRKIDPSKSKVNSSREAVRDINVVFVTFQVNMLKDCLLYFCHSRPPKKDRNSPSPSLAPIPQREKSYDLRQSFPERSWNPAHQGTPLTRQPRQRQAATLSSANLCKSLLKLRPTKAHSVRIS